MCCPGACVTTWAIVNLWWKGEDVLAMWERGEVGVKPTPGPTVCTWWSGPELCVNRNTFMMHTHKCTRMHTHNAHTHEHTHARTHTMHTRMHIHMHTHTMHTYTCTHTCTHTHIPQVLHMVRWGRGEWSKDRRLTSAGYEDTGRIA